jgi:hypothetical protein
MDIRAMDSGVADGGAADSGAAYAGEADAGGAGVGAADADASDAGAADGSAADGSAADGIAADGSAVDGSAAADGSAVDGSVAVGNAADGDAADGDAAAGDASDGSAAYGSAAYGGAPIPTNSAPSSGFAEVDAEAAVAGGEGELPLEDGSEALGSGGGSSPGGALGMGVAAGSLLDKPISPKPEELDDFVEDLPVPIASSPRPYSSRRRMVSDPSATYISQSSSSSSSSSPGAVVWSHAELKRLRQSVEQYGLDKWSLVAAKVMGGKSEMQCRDKAESMRAAGELDVGRSRWSEAEVDMLQEAVEQHGRSWKDVAQAMQERGSDKRATQCQTKAYSLQNSGKIALPSALLESTAVQWSAAEDELLKQGLAELGRDWPRIAGLVRSKSGAQCSARATELRKTGLLGTTVRNRHEAWTEAEVDMLRAAVKKHGSNWVAVAKDVGGLRTNEECRAQASYMLSYHRIEPYELQSRTRWSREEVELLYKAVEQHGRQWAKVCLHIPGRNRADVTRKAQLEMRAGRMMDPGGKRNNPVSSPAGVFSADTSGGAPPPSSLLPPLLPGSDADVAMVPAAAAPELDFAPPPPPTVSSKRKPRLDWSHEELEKLHEAVLACPRRAWTKIQKFMGSERRIGDIGRKVDLEMRAKRLVLPPDTTTNKQ